MALQDGPTSGLPPDVFGMTALLHHHGVVASNADYRASKKPGSVDLEEDDVEILPPIRRADHNGPAQFEQLLTLLRASHSAQLYILIGLARQVESAHRGSAACPIGLAEHLSALFTLPHPGRHGSDASCAIEAKDALTQSLEAIDALTNDLKPPVGACNSWRELYRGLSIFRAGLVWQSHLEHNAYVGGSLEVAEVLNG